VGSLARAFQQAVLAHAVAKPENKRVILMMDPEARVSALIVHHLDCIYFPVGETADYQLERQGSG